MHKRQPGDDGVRPLRLPIIAPWGRWPAQISQDGRRIVADAHRAQGSSVGPVEAAPNGLSRIERAAIAFANLRTADESVAFAADHGLLGLAVHDLLAVPVPLGLQLEDLWRWRRNLDEPSAGGDHSPLRIFLQAAGALGAALPLWEEVERWHREARRLRAVFDLHRLLRGDEVEAGELEALSGDAIRLLGWRPPVRDQAAVDAYAASSLESGPPGPDLTGAPPDASHLDVHPLRMAAPALLVHAIRPRLSLLRAEVRWSSPAGARAAWMAPTLLCALWAGAWQTTASGFPVRRCRRYRCRRLFVPQRITGVYCSRACERAAAQQRWRDSRKR
jgi:hypothetical protein